MDLTAELMGVLIVLLPGFITARVIAALFVTRQGDAMERVSVALQWALVDYVAFQVTASRYGSLSSGFVTLWSIPGETAGKPLPVRVTMAVPSIPYGLFAILGIAVVVGVVAAAFCRHGWHMWLMRKIGVTLRTTHASIWADAFHSYRRGYVHVKCASGDEFIGYAWYFSDVADEGSLMLVCPHKVDSSGQVKRLALDRLLLTGVTRIQAVGFSQPPLSQFRIWARAFWDWLARFNMWAVSQKGTALDWLKTWWGKIA